MSKDVSTTYWQVSRERLREMYQPSRIVLAVVRKDSGPAYNVLPLCFHSWCSYSPLLYCVAIQRTNYSKELFEKSQECCLAMPGENLLEVAAYCGSHSGRVVDKAKECNIQWMKSQEISTPGIQGALANMELKILEKRPVGDHLMVVSEVVSIVMSDSSERLLLSIGPKSDGYDVLWKHGIHTIGVISKHDRGSGTVCVE